MFADMSAIQGPVKDVFMQQQILDAAKKLFQVHGLHKVTMDDVAKAVGKGRSSLYYYYKSKDEIFNAVMDAEIYAMLTAISEAVAKSTTIEEKLHVFMATKLAVLREKRSFFSMLDVGMDADALSRFNRIKVAHHNLIMKQEGALMQQILIAAMQKGEIPTKHETELSMLVYVLLSSLHGLKREMAMENNFNDIEAAVSALTSVIVHGLKN